MKNKLEIFSNNDFGQVRTMEINGTVLFVGSDVAKSLGYAIPSKAVNTHCKGVSKTEVPSNGGVQEMLVIKESDVYRLIVHSKLPTAEKFEKWLFEEVLPSIRKTGSYSNVPQSFAEALQLAADQAKQLEQQKPKVLFADSVSSSKTNILIGELSKLLKQNGKDIGQNRLFSYLRDNGYLISRKGTDYNMPTQKSMNLGLFSIKETAITHSDGHITVNKTTKVTGKGQIYFINKILGD